MPRFQCSDDDESHYRVARQVAAGLDVLIAPPRCVQTGLDLVDFPTIFWAEIEYSVYTLRQASRRSWRIGQTHPVEVYFAVYEGTMQAEALSLVGRKLRAALLVEGELPQEGLATQERDDGDLLLTLAKRLASGERADAQALESLFADSLALEAQAGETIEGEAWETLADPEQGWGATALGVPTSPATPTPKQQLALPMLLPQSSPASDAATIHGNVDASTPGRALIALVPADREDRFTPSTGRVVPLVGPLALTAPPPPSRRRRPPARDQLRLFG